MRQIYETLKHKGFIVTIVENEVTLYITGNHQAIGSENSNMLSIKNLTKAQTNLITFMKDGEMLYWSNEPSDKRCWLDVEGEEHTISVSTVGVLEKLGIIEQDNEVPIGTYHFVE